MKNVALLKAAQESVATQHHTGSSHEGALPNGATYVINLVTPPAPAHDSLIRKPGPLEVAAWRRAVKEGRLPVVTLGRFEYAKASDLVALVDTLGSEQRAKKSPQLRAVEPSSALAELAVATRRRGAR